MRRLRHLFKRLLARASAASRRLLRRGRPEDIPRRLSADALERAMAEARFLFTQHGVDVRSLVPGETPDMPRPADGSEPP